jgi:hypothetical protein
MERSMMSKAHYYLFAIIFLAFLPHWSVAVAKGFEDDTSECRNLLESKDYVKAVSICTEAAKGGDLSAQFNLSVIYSNGWGVSKNEAEGLRLLRASADQRYPPAQYALASRYAAGSGISKDTKESVRLLADAAGQGFLLAEMLLGKSYESGYKYLGIDKDIRKAIYWYQQAAVQCDACQYELWRIYYNGLGVEKDYAEAARFLKRAAEAGLPKAQMQLAFRYNKGEGVPKDNVQAYMWFYIAEKGGDPLAKKARPLSAKKISKSQVDEAKAMARVVMETPINVKQLCELYQQFCGDK